MGSMETKQAKTKQSVEFETFSNSLDSHSSTYLKINIIIYTLLLLFQCNCTEELDIAIEEYSKQVRGCAAVKTYFPGRVLDVKVCV